ncbi:MAG TPA: hypothetical protein VFB96_10045 [Pirellulaceae bacterium]|nr:hypothetical protein [Pirellulaceae bacterium]
MRPTFWGALLAASLLLAGCDHSTGGRQPGSSASSAQQPAGPKRYTAEDLPEVGERLPPLDDGRVDFAAPKDWRTLSRDWKFLARFVKGQQDNSLPRITVSAMPASPAMEDVTEENVGEFTGQMQSRSQEVEGRKLLEPERPIILGDHAWSRHVRQLRGRSGHAVVQSLATARGGRLYLIELTVDSAGDSNDDFAKAILTHRDTAYAVAASWKFLGEAAKEGPKSPDNESPAKTVQAADNSEAGKKGE